MKIPFRFHGYAVAAAGRLTSPYSELIEAQAATALPSIGGRASARVDNFAYRDIFKFDRAYSEVTGNDCDGECCASEKLPEGSTSTHLRCAVEGVDILSMFTADRIVANLSSSHSGKIDDEPSVRLIGTRFENLKIAGIPVKVELNTPVFDKYPTHDSLVKAYPGDTKLQNQIDRPGVENAKEQPHQVRHWLRFRQSAKVMPAYRGQTFTSLVSKITPDGEGLDCWGHVIHVPGFATIRLAEIEITQRTRLVNMVQICLDCPYKGQFMMCMIADGGEGYSPN